jgi:hypothetical protein
VKEAFLRPWNLAALGTAALGTAVTANPNVLLAALGLEGLYLAGRTAVFALRRARGGERDGGGFEDLADSQKEHYLSLKATRDRILENYRKLPGGRILAANSEPQLDQLLGSFVRLVSTLNAYRRFLSTQDRRTLERELSELEGEVRVETNAQLQQVKQKRVEILRKRVDRFRKAEESRELVSHQLAGMEDLLKLTHEQSIALRDPQNVAPALARLTEESKSTEATVAELERFMDVTDA